MYVYYQVCVNIADVDDMFVVACLLHVVFCLYICIYFVYAYEQVYVNICHIIPKYDIVCKFIMYVVCVSICIYFLVPLCHFRCHHKRQHNNNTNDSCKALASCFVTVAGINPLYSFPVAATVYNVGGTICSFNVDSLVYIYFLNTYSFLLFSLLFF